MSKLPHILIIDGDPSSRQSLSATFRGEFFVSLAEDGNDAYEKAVHHRPQVVILDPNMPHYDGMTTMRKFRRDIRLADIPIVVLTTDASRGSVMACAKAGVRAYLLKSSVNYAELAKTIRNLL